MKIFKFGIFFITLVILNCRESDNGSNILFHAIRQKYELSEVVQDSESKRIYEEACESWLKANSRFDSNKAIFFYSRTNETSILEVSDGIYTKKTEQPITLSALRFKVIDRKCIWKRTNVIK